MKRTRSLIFAAAVAVIIIGCLGSASSAAGPDDCSCESSDCSASISCSGACISFCGDGGNCYAECGGGYMYLAAETTVEFQNARYPDLVDQLAKRSGKRVAFTPATPNMIFSAGFKRSPFWNVLDLLSDQGTVQIDGQDFEKLRRLRRSLLSGERVTLCVKNTPVNVFVSDMIGITGLALRVERGNPNSIINVKLPQSTLDEMLLKISEQTGARIREAATDSGDRQ